MRDLVWQVRGDEQGSQRSKAGTLWVRNAQERGYAYCEQTSEQKIVSLDAVRQELWSKEALNVDSSTAVGSRTCASCFLEQASGRCRTFLL